jgi:hypothetical protein
MLRGSFGLFVLTVLGLLLGVPQVTRAAESYDNCTGYITSVPAAINSQGTWCLKQDLTTSISSGTAIKINADNVTLDCNDFKLDGLAAGAATHAYGINASGRLNTTVRNCNIRGFFYGALLTGSGHAAEDNRFEGNTYIGLDIQGDGSVARSNRVFDTGGSTQVASAYGIAVNDSVDVLDNTVTNVFARSGGNGNAYAIFTSGNASASINGNRVRGEHGDGTGIAYGIYNSLSDRITLRNNDVVGDGSSGSVGLRCANAHGRARENVINGFFTGVSICSNDAGNVIAN